MEMRKSMMKKKSKEDKKTLAKLSSVHHHSQAKCQLVQTNYIRRIKLFLFAIIIINIVLTELSRPVW